LNPNLTISPQDFSLLQVEPAVHFLLKWAGPSENKRATFRKKVVGFAEILNFNFLPQWLSESKFYFSISSIGTKKQGTRKAVLHRKNKPSPQIQPLAERLTRR